MKTRMYSLLAIVLAHHTAETILLFCDACGFMAANLMTAIK